MPEGCRYLLTPWLAATLILFGAFSPALAEGSAEPFRDGAHRGAANSTPAGRRSVRSHRSHRTGPHRCGLSRQARCHLFRLHPLPRRVPDRAAGDLARARCFGGGARAPVQPLFITVDPERDTPSVLADYVSSFHARLVALTGPAPAIRSVALAYKVFFAKSATVGPDGYAIDHTGFIYLVGKDGRYIDFLDALRFISIARTARSGLRYFGTCQPRECRCGKIERWWRLADAVAGNGLLDRRLFLSAAAAAALGSALPSKAGELPIEPWMKLPGSGFVGYGQPSNREQGRADICVAARNHRYRRGTHSALICSTA